MPSPYEGKTLDQWRDITVMLVREHPLELSEIRDVVLKSWDEILNAKIGDKPYIVGVDIFPKPQIMGFFLHEIIPLEFERRHPGLWRVDKSGDDKDLVFNENNGFSVEIKTSSNPNSIFGNRSYAQQTQRQKKDKSGYYLAINFEKFSENPKIKPKITKIRFGWLDHSDWIGQKAASGQQAHLSKEAESLKLIEIVI